MTRVAVLRDAAIPSGTGQWGAIQSVAPSFGVELRAIEVHDAGEIEHAITAFARFAEQRHDPDGECLLVTTSQTDHYAGAPAQAADGSTFYAVSSQMEVSSPTGPIRSTYIGARQATSIAFSRARNRPRQSSLVFWERGAQNRGKERHLVDVRRQLSDELFQAVVQ